MKLLMLWRIAMKYVVTMAIFLIFSMPLAFATGGGGTSLEQMRSDTKDEKQVVQLIDPSSKDQSKQKICSRNQGTSIELVLC